MNVHTKIQICKVIAVIALIGMFGGAGYLDNGGELAAGMRMLAINCLVMIGAAYKGGMFI